MIIWHKLEVILEVDQKVMLDLTLDANLMLEVMLKAMLQVLDVINIKKIFNFMNIFFLVILHIKW